MAKWAAQIDSADRVPEYVARAFHTAMQGRPGPVVLALPEDMLTTHTAAPVVPRVQVASAWPAPGALREVRSLLLASKQPLLIAGGSGWDAEACAALQRFAENWQLPVGCGFRFQDTFDNRHPQYAGDVGIGINPKLGARVRDADLIIALGIRLGEMTTGGYSLLQVPRPVQKLIHVHAGPEELGRVYQADLLLQSSMQHAAKALETLTAPPDLPWREWTAAARRDYDANLEPTAVSPLDLAQVMKTVQRLAPADTVYTNGAGNFAGWLHRFVQYHGLQHHGRTQLAPTSGAMGYGVPAAIAASLLYPQRTVVNVAGDGDFLMTGQEFATAVQYDLPIIVVVINKWDLFDEEVRGLREEEIEKRRQKKRTEGQAKPMTTLAEFGSWVQKKLFFLDYAPVIFTSAKSGFHLDRLLEAIRYVAAQLQQKIPTAILNRTLRDAVERRQPISAAGHRLKFYYATQVRQAPPTFLLFVNRDELFSDAYKKYLAGELRTAFGYEGCPVVLVPRARPKTIEPMRKFKPKHGKPASRQDSFQERRHQKYSRSPKGNRPAGRR